MNILKSSLIIPGLAILLQTNVLAEQLYSTNTSSLIESIQEVSKISNIPYIVDTNILKGKSAKIINSVEGVNKALEEILRGSGLDFVIKNNTIIIKEKSNKVKEHNNQNRAKLGDITVKSDFLSNVDYEDLQYFGGSRTVIDIDKSKNLGDASISDSMKRIPGVISSKQDGTGGSSSSLNIGVRGMAQRLSPRTTVLLDGIPLSVAPYGQPQLSLAPVSFDMLSSIDVIRGGGSVRYGPQNVGGIINFNTKDIPEEFQGTIQASGTYYTEGESKLEGKSYSLFTGGMINENNGLALFYDGKKGSSWRDHSKTNIDNIMLKTKHKLNDNHTLKTRLTYYTANNDMPGGLTQAEYEENPYQSKRPYDNFEGDRKELALFYDGQLSDTTFAEIKTFYNTSDRTFIYSRGASDISTRLDTLPREYKVFGLEARVSEQIKLGSIDSELSFGYRYIKEDADEKRHRRSFTAGSDPYSVSAVTNRDSHNETKAHALYTDWRFDLDKLTLTPGLRYEKVDISRLNNLTAFEEDINYTKALPSLNVSYKLNDSWTTYGSYNKSFGSVQHLQLNLQDKGQNTLKPETADIYEVGARYFNDNADFETTLFYIDFEDQLGYSSVVKKWENRGKTVHKGIELAGNLYLDDIAEILEGSSFYGNYTYLDARYKETNVNNYIEFTSKHTGLIGYKYSENNDWSAFIEMYYQSEQYADNLNTQDENTAASLGTMPAYALTNIGYTKSLDLANNDLSFSLGVKNLFNKEYFTRSTDTLGNGKYIGAPREIYFSMKYDF